MDFFLYATQNKLRFVVPQTGGSVSTEQLFDLPLTKLDLAARFINTELKSVTEESFIETAKPDPRKGSLTVALEIVKAVIAIKQEANAALAKRRERAEQRQVLLSAIEASELRELSTAGVADLKAKLAALDD